MTAAGVASDGAEAKPLGDDPLARVHVESGVCLNLVQAGLVTEQQLDGVFTAVEELAAGSALRHFGGRFIWDHKLFGERAADVPAPCAFLNPLVQAMTKLAEDSLAEGEDLALLQVLVNHLGGAIRWVKPHRHRCRHLCLSLGEACPVEVEGQPMVMRHGDCLPLGGELHGVPLDAGRRLPRASVCLFYASAAEFANGSVGVGADGGLHFVHPEDQPPHPSLVEEAQLGDHAGTVKYVSDIYDYGIILCAALKELGYDDVFVKKKKLVRCGLAVGSEVSFSAYVNKKGTPQVKDLLGCEETSRRR